MNEARSERVALVTGAASDNIAACPADILALPALAAAMDLAADRFGGLDVLVAAAVISDCGRIDEMRPELVAGFGRADIPVGRMAQPVEIARCVDFLASEEASSVNGTSLVADGGVLAKLGSRI